MTDDTSDRVVLTDDDTSESGGDAQTAEISAAARLVVSDDRDGGIYEGMLDGVAAAGVVYARTGGRVTLLATSVFPQFRGQGVAAALLSKVLDDIRSQGGTVTVTCPFTARFLKAHPEYSDLIDPDLPGAPRHQH